MNTIILLLSGKAECGKDLFYCLTRDWYSWYFYVSRLAYADKVKEIARAIGWDGKKDDKGRLLLQWLGDGARDYSPDVWIEHLKKELIRLLEHNKSGHIIVVTDCRYPNEIDSIKEQFPNAFSVRIERPGHENSLTEEQREHPSETSLDEYEFDYTITNTGNLIDYMLAINMLVSKILSSEVTK